MEGFIKFLIFVVLMICFNIFMLFTLSCPGREKCEDIEEAFKYNWNIIAAIDLLISLLASLVLGPLHDAEPVVLYPVIGVVAICILILLFLPFDLTTGQPRW